MFTLFRDNKKPLLKRFSEDPPTAQRLKYRPYYLSFENQTGSHVWLDGKEHIMLSSNDYLGLTTHPKVIEAGKRALDTWGSSTTGSRLSNGSRACHEELEECLADFLGKEACQVFSAGYLGCMASVSSFINKDDLVLVDRNVHSSLWSGINLTRARVERFGHNDPDDLRDVLKKEDESQPKFLIIEGVYSMEGHIARLPEFVDVIRGQNCVTILDDAHGLGVFGQNGRGVANHFNVTSNVDIICGSFSKSLASTGGYIAGSRNMIEYLRTYSKQTIFSAAISPVQAACANAALNVLKSEPEHLEKLWDNTNKYRKILRDLNLNTWSSESPAIPIVIGDKAKAYYFWKDLMNKGVFTVMSIAPGVPPGKDLVRTAVSATHTDADMERVAEALKYATKRLK